MAQGKVTEFFSSRKRNASLQPSKRRKVQRLETPETTEQIETPVIPVEKNVRITRRAQKCNTIDSKTKSVSSVKQTRRNTRTKNKKAVESQGKDISSFFNASPEHTVDSDETTAVRDDHHASPISTPTKSVPKRGLQKTQIKDVLDEINSRTPESEKAYDFAKFVKPKVSPEVSARRKLQLQRKASPKDVSATPKEAPVQLKSASAPKAASGKSKEPVLKEIDATKLNPAEMRKRLQKCGKLSELKQQLAKLDKGVARIKEAQEAKLREQPPEEDTVQVKVDDKVKPDVKGKSKIKVTSKVTAEAKPPEGKSAAKEEAQSVAKVPAYQRFHNLAQPVPPSLTLPYKYEVLDEMFHSVEVVVSMLHKRAEVCTFGKLKNAVQQMMRKSFEERNLGQIKTVYPAAYILRQEKGLPDFQKTQNANVYQLTVEADLNQDLEGYMSESKVKPEYDSQGRPIISATRLLKRKAVFHRLLIDLVKQHHKKFLESLSPPLKVPDDKMTRWHPRFRVDEVPDIPSADLPKAPDVKKFKTAAEALQHATATMNPRMKNALEIVAAKNAKNQEDKNKAPLTPTTKTNTPATAEKTSNAGVPQSLLERIRAKEAANQELAMMRSPAQDQRLARIGRLPEIVRIIRTMFVTQKKPAIPWEDTITKISDSYRSCLGEVEAEQHIKLLLELCPEWLSVIQITRGRFLKIDKNKDTTVITNKLAKMSKQ